MYLIYVEETKYSISGYPLCIVNNYTEFMNTHKDFFLKQQILNLIIYKKDEHSEFLEETDWINVYEYYGWVTDE